MYKPIAIKVLVNQSLVNWLVLNQKIRFLSLPLEPNHNFSLFDVQLVFHYLLIKEGGNKQTSNLEHKNLLFYFGQFKVESHAL